MIESVLAVVAGDGKEAGRGETLVEGVGKGVADPRESGLPGAVVEREYKHNSTTGLDDFGGGSGLRECWKSAEKEQQSRQWLLE
jgi:hypothetical protein